MLRSFFLLLFLITVANNSHGQNTTDSLKLPEFKEYQFNLPGKAKEIRMIEYEKTGMPMNGRLSPDSSAILLRNYQRGQPLRVRVVMSDGTVQEFVKSPCFIDPVINVL